MKKKILKITMLSLLLASQAKAGIGVIPCVYFAAVTSGKTMNFQFTFKLISKNSSDPSNDTSLQTISFPVTNTGVTCASSAAWIGVGVDTDNDKSYEGDWNASYSAESTPYSGDTNMRVRLHRTPAEEGADNSLNSDIKLSNQTHGATICSQGQTCSTDTQYLNNGETRYLIFTPAQ